jgi:hypothetical protein
MMIKCKNCRKKSLIEYKCRCELIFCLGCLPFYNHNCSFDHKGNKREQLEKENPKTIAIKVSSI